MSKVSCRKAFTRTILEIARQSPDIYAVATDSRGSVTINGFADELPGQFVEVGIAEQNAVGVAAGLSLIGRNVFVTGPACFLSARAYEQIKIDAAYNNSNVKIVGVSAGVSYGPLGGTHTSLHDIAGMRCLPNIMVFAPCDDVQTKAVTHFLAQYHGPAYMRMGRGDVEAIYEKEETFQIGKAKEIASGNDVTIIAYGEMIYPAKLAAEILKAQKINARVLDMFTLKPYDQEAIIRAAQETGGIVTVEEHSINGGLGELVAHVAAEYAPVKIKIMGFPDEECKVGKSGELFAYYGFTPDNIAEQAKKLIMG